MANRMTLPFGQFFAGKNLPASVGFCELIINAMSSVGGSLPKQVETIIPGDLVMQLGTQFPSRKHELSHEIGSFCR